MKQIFDKDSSHIDSVWLNFICFLCTFSDPYPNMLAMSRHVQLPPRFGLPDVNATLQNMELWQQFHEIGTEMIITKSGR